MAVIEQYTSKQATRLCGVTQRMIDYWVTQGLLTPSVNEGKGTGHARLFNFTDLCILRTIHRLRTSGVSLMDIRKIVERLRAYGHDFTNIVLFFEGGDVYLEDEPYFISLLRQPGQRAFAWVINVGVISQEVREAIKHEKAA